ncbi:molecular chaperone Hsp20 [Lacticaseibacillus chiayiensis]|uniref:Hsp20/alpha crystallin family protein n=1 Tax=Lacticaseibacillus chiayiensis TaxID=2100821 RepID=A0A4Q1UCS2_9LACO|nr:Hsp20/alpha crystallin family protein [Lacticaseibacillus chiayiensis]QVI34684.1 Hsp20/alpha crystallin family protein [Lacticaseibacillus chiayiensis]RXT29766.1 molecular chaperone Hsp20 [Lacticaseibacillus chiayiensis]UYN57882.1 Hsp20/alpha crystallin family protein [Lacticaseibacillus chiayiensis]
MANDLTRRNDWLDDPFFNDLGRHIFDSLTPSRSDDTSRLLKTDIQENEKSYVVKVDVPGIEKPNINLSYDHGVLSVAVKHEEQADHSDNKGNLLMSERSYGRMSRSYQLPNVDEAKISAKVTDGVLTIDLPKMTSEQIENHQITID